MGYSPALVLSGFASLSNERVRGPLNELRVASQGQVVNLRPLWVDPSEGAIVAVQGTVTVPEERSYVRLVALSPSGIETGEAYVPANSFFCNIRKPYTRLENGDLVRLSLLNNQFFVERVVLVSPGSAVLEPISAPPSSELILQDQSIFTELETLNGTASVSTVTIPSITRRIIIQRARSALEAKWYLAPRNYSRAGVLNTCSPPTQVWRRPPRLDAHLDKHVIAIPYRWGGHFQSLKVFEEHLAEGRLAGDDCTCRNANCITQIATGLDCSGFVSMAWMTGSYFTTRSLPSRNVSSQISWSQIKPGDIANKAGNHVRLVESISRGPKGPVVTVIESASNRSCGGVCRRSYLQADLQSQRYVPLRRLAVED